MASYLVDTNILLRSADDKSTQHFEALEAVGVSHLLTFNVDDFPRPPGVIIVHPSEVV